LVLVQELSHQPLKVLRAQSLPKTLKALPVELEQLPPHQSLSTLNQSLMKSQVSPSLMKRLVSKRQLKPQSTLLVNKVYLSEDLPTETGIIPTTGRTEWMIKLNIMINLP